MPVFIINLIVPGAGQNFTAAEDARQTITIVTEAYLNLTAWAAVCKKSVLNAL